MTAKLSRIAVTATLLATACAHAPASTRASGPEARPVCKQSSTDLAGIVERESHRFAVCAELADPSATQHEYVLAFVATPAGRAQSTTVFRADLEPVEGPVATCFAAVLESVGLARAGSSECPVTVPLVVPADAIAGATPSRGATSSRDVDGWMVSSLKSAPTWPHD